MELNFVCFVLYVHMYVFICVRVYLYDIAPLQQPSELLGVSFLLLPCAHVCPGDQTQILGSVANALNH